MVFTPTSEPHTLDKGVLFVELFAGQGTLSQRVASKGVDALNIPDIQAGGPDLRTPEGATRVLHQVRRARRGRKVVAYLAPP